MSLEQDIKDRALALGFDAVGITDASAIEPAHVEHLRSWLAAGYAGQMAYMKRNVEKRICPARLLEGAQSVVVVALNYKPPGGNDRAAAPSPLGRVAEYAWYDDYHDFMKPLLRELAEFIISRAGDRHRFKVCVDSAPVAERALAARAGLGFIGRSHMLIHPKLGPQVFLAELITTVPLEADEPLSTSCSECRRCTEACPTGALRPDGRFDATRCISYLTIEHRGPFAEELAARIGDRVFGCDECVLACPHHADAPPRANPGLRFVPERSTLSLPELLCLDEHAFAEAFAGSPILRTGLAAIQRNARICLANAAGRSD
jgi:epoxyqueuosine reductase